MKKFHFLLILSNFLFFINGYCDSWFITKYNFAVGEDVLVRVDDKDIGRTLALGNLAGGNIYIKGKIQEIIPVTQKTGAKSEVIVDKTIKVNLDRGQIVSDSIDDIVPIRPKEIGRRFFNNESVLVSKTDRKGIPIYLEGNFLGIEKDKRLRVRFPGEKKFELVTRDQVVPLDTINEINVPECSRKNVLYFWNEAYNMPQYNQGPDGICYAYEGIQLIDMYRVVYQDGQKGKQIDLSNAVMAGLLSRAYQMQVQRKVAKVETLAGGFSGNVVEALKYYGMCSPQAIHSSLAKFFKDKGAVDPQKFYFLTIYFITYDGPGGLRNSVQAKRQFKQTISKKEAEEAAVETMKSIKGSKMDKWLSGMEKDVEMEAITEALLPYLMNEDYIGFLQDVFSDCLKNDPNKEFYKGVPPTRHCDFPDLKNPRKVYDIITGELDRPRIKVVKEGTGHFPQVSYSANDSGSSGIGISYCSRVVKNRNVRGLKPDRSGFTNNCGNHASIIVGKRARGGRCQFLVRNTWGNSCKYDWECEKNQQGQEEGFWVDAEALVDNIYKLDYFIPTTSGQVKHPICPVFKMK